MILGYFVLALFLLCAAAVIWAAIIRIPDLLYMAYELFLRWFKPGSYQALMDRRRAWLGNQSREREERWKIAVEEEAETKRKAIQDAAEAERRRKEFLEWLDYSDVKGPWGPHSSRGELFLSPKAVPHAVDNRLNPDRKKRLNRNARSSRDVPDYRSYSSPRHSYPIYPSPLKHTPTDVVPIAPRRRNRSSIVKKFEDAGIHLYHFTPAENEEGISRLNGLLPRDALEKKGFAVHYLSSVGSRNTDDRKGLSSYVHLAFHDVHSMLSAVKFRRAGEIIVYQVSLLVLDLEGCCFTRSLANANVAVLTPIDEINRSDLAVIASGGEEAKKWQLLVPSKIPRSYLREHSRHQGLDDSWRPGLYS
jgi:hypothetical protein